MILLFTQSPHSPAPAPAPEAISTSPVQRVVVLRTAAATASCRRVPCVVVHLELVLTAIGRRNGDSKARGSRAHGVSGKAVEVGKCPLRIKDLGELYKGIAAVLPSVASRVAGLPSVAIHGHGDLALSVFLEQCAKYTCGQLGGDVGHAERVSALHDRPVLHLCDR